MKFLKILCVLAAALCLTASVYAETQSVKVSGDLTVRGIGRTHYDYASPHEAGNVFRTDTGSSAEYAWWMSTTEVEIDADLTDNVQTVIRLINQRDWNATNATAGYGILPGKNIQSTTTLAQNGVGGYNYNPGEFAVGVDLAYLTLKNFIYSPLTLTIGRQDLWLGRGFIVGANQQNPTFIFAPEYTAENSFDAIKAVLDYDPWTITGIYSNIRTNAIMSNDGIDLLGANIGYKFDSYKAESEGYFFLKKDKSIERWSGGDGSQLKGAGGNNDVYTLGLRGSFDPIDVITLAGEGAYQFGSYIGNRLQWDNRERSAFALDFSGELRYFTDKFSWKPKVGAEYIIYSGNKPESNEAASNGVYTGWDMMYRGKFDSAIREYVGRFYASREYPVRPDFTISNADASFTNQQQLIFSGSLQPMDSLSLKANYNIFWCLENYLVDEKRKTSLIGQEVDIMAKWDYTEDVSFNVLGAVFAPGGVYIIDNQTAGEVVGSVSVSF